MISHTPINATLVESLPTEGVTQIENCDRCATIYKILLGSGLVTTPLESIMLHGVFDAPDELNNRVVYVQLKRRLNKEIFTYRVLYYKSNYTSKWVKMSELPVMVREHRPDFLRFVYNRLLDTLPPGTPLHYLHPVGLWYDVSSAEIGILFMPLIHTRQNLTKWYRVEVPREEVDAAWALTPKPTKTVTLPVQNYSVPLPDGLKDCVYQGPAAPKFDPMLESEKARLNDELDSMLGAVKTCYAEMPSLHNVPVSFVELESPGVPATMRD